jgi:prophage regulatory protein
MQQTSNEHFLKLSEVVQQVKLSKSQIFRLIGEKRFPAPVRLGERASRFVESEVNAWIAHRIAASRAKNAA